MDVGSRIATSHVEFTVRRARAEDVPEIVDLLIDDRLGKTRESQDMAAYHQAFEEITGDPQHFLAVCEDLHGRCAGTFHLTLIPGLSRGATKRLQVESVRVAAAARGSGLGSAMFTWAEKFGRAHGATLLQLTSDKSRGDAIRFYEDLGFTASHEGLKKAIRP
jgi:GNAT superfamily N-acetyltransferase